MHEITQYYVNNMFMVLIVFIWAHVYEHFYNHKLLYEFIEKQAPPPPQKNWLIRVPVFLNQIAFV